MYFFTLALFIAKSGPILSPLYNYNNNNKNNNNNNNNNNDNDNDDSDDNNNNFFIKSLKSFTNSVLKVKSYEIFRPFFQPDFISQ